MIELLQAIWDEIIIRLWNFGTRSARLVIRVAILGVVFFVVIPLLVWPFVLFVLSHVDSHLGTGYTAVATFLPLAAFVVFTIFSIVFLALAYPLLSGILVAIPQFRSFLGWFVVALVAAIFGNIVWGLYLSFVPIWSTPWWLTASFVLLVVVLGLWLFLKQQLRWQWGGWVTPTLATAIVGITIVFVIASFFGGKKEAEAQAAQPTEQQLEMPAVPSMENIKEVVRISLLGEGVPSEQALLLPGMIPPRWYYYFEGPSTAQVHFDDGTVSSITKWYGMKGGRLRFSGPKGEEVTVRAYPPPK